MQKELNPDLFGGIARNQGRMVPNSISSSTNSSANGTPQANEASLVAEFDRRILDLRGQIQNLVDQMNRFGKQVEEALKAQQSAIEGLQKDMIRIDKDLTEGSSQTHQTQSKYQNQVLEGRQIEKKVEMMLDRHQNVLRNYEVRVNQLQRMIEKKDEQLMSLQSSLMETKSEIARLKRL